MKNSITYLPKKSLSLENGPALDRRWTGHESGSFLSILTLFLMLFSFGVGNVWGTNIYTNAGATGTSGGVTATGNINNTAANGNPAPAFGLTSAGNSTITITGLSLSSYSSLSLSVDAKYGSYPNTTNTWPYITVTFYKNEVVVKTDNSTIKWTSKTYDYGTYTISDNVPDFDKVTLVCSPAQGKTKQGAASTSYAAYLDNIVISGTSASCATAPTVGAPSNSSFL